MTLEEIRAFLNWQLKTQEQENASEVILWLSPKDLMLWTSNHRHTFEGHHILESAPPGDEYRKEQFRNA